MLLQIAASVLFSATMAGLTAAYASQIGQIEGLALTLTWAATFILAVIAFFWIVEDGQKLAVRRHSFLI